MKKIEKNLKLLVILALLCAISIVAGKYLGINAGEFMRFSLENMPIIFAGIAFGPIAGCLVGTIADLIGCALMGWAPIPWITVGAAAIGSISGIVPIILKKAKLPFPLLVALSVFCAHLLGSIIIKTIGLSAQYDTPFGILLLWRMLNYAIIGSLDGVIVYILLKNKEIQSKVLAIRRKENDIR
jgi:ECF transporter S component (folate family)